MSSYADTNFEVSSPHEPESAPIPLQPLRSLCDMLTYRRVSGSRTETKFINRFIRPLGAKPDSMGNMILRIGDSPVLFSSHTDSVHTSSGRQRLIYKNGVLKVKHPKPDAKAKPKTVTYSWTDKDGKVQTGSYTTLGASRNQCLGADDAVGCWIMREMALAGIPGLYIWHRQEESGGVGSAYIADNHREVLEGIKAAIAFDRRGFDDVITHQAGGRCASDIFAESLAGQLPGKYRPCSGGVFTDTANYTELVAECTNISVGYDHEHTERESLDLAHALDVRNAMLDFDASKLEFRRNPGEKDYSSYGSSNWGCYSRGYEGYEENEKASSRDFYRDQHAKRNYPGYSAWIGENQEPLDNDEPRHVTGRQSRDDFDGMVEMIRLNPEYVADMLEEYGMDAKGLRDELYQRGASLHRL